MNKSARTCIAHKPLNAVNDIHEVINHRSHMTLKQVAKRHKKIHVESVIVIVQYRLTGCVKTTVLHRPNIVRTYSQQEQ